MLKVLKNLFDDNAREIHRLEKTVATINELEDQMAKLSDQELQAKTTEFKRLLEDGRSLEDILPQAFAVCREAAKRVLNMRHFDVQLMGGVVLHQGRVAEMSTGEGKTLVATLAAYLNALSGKGVHIITANDYLAARDKRWMGKLYEFLGLSVGLLLRGLSLEERRRAYTKDIVYGTNSEFCFDYLRDNLAYKVKQRVQRELNYAIIDEADNILIDEARTPLIITGKSNKLEEAPEFYYKISKIISQLEIDKDYAVDEKLRTVVFTEEGVDRVEELLGVENLYDEANTTLNHNISQALKAHALLQLGRDYVVTNGQVVVVDEFTGRLMYGRRYSDGLHQAVEAKEGLEIKLDSNNIAATITFQNYFRLYEKLAGMTGTASTEEQEFRSTYGMSVVEIPTNKPMIRQDLSDVVYKTESAKFRAVVNDIVQRYQAGQPVLVGTTSVARSELLSALLKRRGVPSRVLNAQHHDKEAEIIAQAGRFKAVTIATNMAGRGIDILLGGNPEVMARTQLKKMQLNPNTHPAEYRQLLEKLQVQCEEEKQRVIGLGGLHIIGTERHESRRVDNQLRGRAGRQGDPGSSQFYVSMEDDLMRQFGSEGIAEILEKIGLEEDMPIENAMITRSIETAQKRMETSTFKIRQQVLDYDNVLSAQREVIYQQRRQLLEQEDITETIKDSISKVVEHSVDMFCPEGVPDYEWDLTGLLEYADKVYLPGHNLSAAEFEETGRQGLVSELTENALKIYSQKEAEIGTDKLRRIERMLLLQIVDQRWIHHLNEMIEFREAVSLRSYGGKNPLTEYKYASIDMFNNMIAEIQEEIVKHLFKFKLKDQNQEELTQDSPGNIQ